MNFQKIARLAYIIILLIVMFVLGYFYGTREEYNKKPNIVDYTANNGAKKNYLTQIERRSVFGAVSSVNSKTPQNFGELLFIQEDNNQTQLLFNLQNVPIASRTSDNREKLIPAELNILLATRNLDGTDFNYESIGKIAFDSPDKTNLRSAKFSTTINKNLFNVLDPSKSIQRIELRPLSPEDENIFTLDNADLPIEVRKRPAAFFWINL